MKKFRATVSPEQKEKYSQKLECVVGRSLLPNPVISADLSHPHHVNPLHLLLLFQHAQSAASPHILLGTHLLLYHLLLYRSGPPKQAA